MTMNRGGNDGYEKMNRKNTAAITNVKAVNIYCRHLASLCTQCTNPATSVSSASTDS